MMSDMGPAAIEDSRPRGVAGNRRPSTMCFAPRVRGDKINMGPSRQTCVPQYRTMTGVFRSPLNQPPRAPY
jgi:hypothetical protein